MGLITSEEAYEVQDADYTEISSSHESAPTDLASIAAKNAKKVAAAAAKPVAPKVVDEPTEEPEGLAQDPVRIPTEEKEDTAPWEGTPNKHTQSRPSLL